MPNRTPTPPHATDDPAARALETAYAHWRDDQMRQFDSDFEQWRAQGGTDFPADFVRWRRLPSESSAAGASGSVPGNRQQ